MYYDKIITHRLYQNNSIYPIDGVWNNRSIAFLSIISSCQLSCLAVDALFDYCLLKQGNGATQSVPRYRYTSQGERVDNITDWGLKQFRSRYTAANPQIRKDDIFNYVYGVLHDPVYREKYALNLKREFPRIPFYSGFCAWADWGARLMALHIGYETIEPWPIRRVDESDIKARAAEVAPKAILKSNRDTGTIRIDSETTLSGIPPQAFDYRLGNRSGLDWILDQYKERSPKDPTVREKFNTYRFSDYKEKVIDLIARVTRVSVETVAIVAAMQKAEK